MDIGLTSNKLWCSSVSVIWMCPPEPEYFSADFLFKTGDQGYGTDHDRSAECHGDDSEADDQPGERVFSLADDFLGYKKLKHAHSISNIFFVAVQPSALSV